MVIPRFARSAITLCVVFLLFIGGEIPAMAGIRALVIPLAKRFVPQAGLTLYVAEVAFGLFSSALWVTVFNPAYTWVGITVAISMPVLAIPATLLVRAGRQGSHVMR